MTRDEFAETVRVLSKGGDVDQEELVEVMSYAGTAWYEIQELTKSLCSGYRRLQIDLRRKDRNMEGNLRVLAAVRAENDRLRERLKKFEGQGERILRSAQTPECSSGVQSNDSEGKDGDVNA